MTLLANRTWLTHTKPGSLGLDRLGSRRCWPMTGVLTVSYDEEPIEQVSRTFIALWNR